MLNAPNVKKFAILKIAPCVYVRNITKPNGQEGILNQCYNINQPKINPC